MPYVSVSHGSDTNYIFNGVFPEGDVSESDLALSETIAKAFIRFAATGNPNDVAAEHEQIWQDAFPTTASEGAGALHLQVIGGPLGTGDAFVTTTQTEFCGYNAILESNGKDPSQLAIHGLQAGSMLSGAALQRSQVIAREKLIDRCSFINGLSDKLGN
jgi:hypothetical protein